MGKKVSSGRNTYNYNKEKLLLLKKMTINTEQLMQAFIKISVRILMRHCANRLIVENMFCVRFYAKCFMFVISSSDEFYKTVTTIISIL